MSPPKKFQSSLKLLTTVSPYYWHQNGAQVFTPMHLQERAQQSDTVTRSVRGSTMQATDTTMVQNPP